MLVVVRGAKKGVREKASMHVVFYLQSEFF
jgi:hypothetical protein